MPDNSSLWTNSALVIFLTAMGAVLGGLAIVIAGFYYSQYWLVTLSGIALTVGFWKHRSRNSIGNALCFIGILVCLTGLLAMLVSFLSAPKPR
jgi:hypothetical protein